MFNNTSSIENNQTEPYCGYKRNHYSIQHAILAFGSFVSLIGICTNLFTIVVLCSVKKFRRSSYVYLLFLAVTDAILCIVYVPLIVFGRYLLTWEIMVVANFWYTAFPTIHTITTGAKTFGTYLIVCATVEKLVLFREKYSKAVEYLLCCTTSRFGTRSRLSRLALKSRFTAVTFVFLLSVFLSLPKFFDVMMVPKNCTGVWSYAPMRSRFSENQTFYKFYREHICSNMSITVPFIVLSLMSARILWRLVRIHQKHKHENRNLNGVSSKPASSVPTLANRKLPVRDTHHSVMSSLASINKECAPHAKQSKLTSVGKRRNVSAVLSRVITNATSVKRRPYNARLRSVTYMVILVVLSYLLSNSLQFILTYWEMLGGISTNEFLHVLASDCVTLMSILVSSTRLVLYLWFGDNVAFKKRSCELCRWLAVCCGLCGKTDFCTAVNERYTSGQAMYLTRPGNASIIRNSTASHNHLSSCCAPSSRNGSRHMDVMPYQDASASPPLTTAPYGNRVSSYIHLERIHSRLLFSPGDGYSSDEGSVAKELFNCTN